MADREVDPSVLSRRGKFGGIHMIIGGSGTSPLVFLKLQESL